MAKPRVILVGGFLGAGKTTLLAEAALRLTRQGKQVGIVANDQAADLVDTQLFRQTGAAVEEVTGGCFCCRFPDMVAAIERIVHQSRIDVILGEPVGSCTDLSATVLQPLKHQYGDRWELAPFTVLIDAAQVRALARLSQAQASSPPERFSDQVLYIYEKQLSEADLIVLNKVDLILPEELAHIQRAFQERLPETPILTMSAATGEGLDAWLERVNQPGPVGKRIVEVDYDRYAAGEAELGWMNLSAKLQAKQPVDWRTFAVELFERIREGLGSRGARIAHVKLFLTSPGAYLAGNLVSNESPAAVRGEMDSSHSAAALLVNARVQTQPEVLQRVVQEALHGAAGDRIAFSITNLRCFFPPRPQPTYRYPNVM